MVLLGLHYSSMYVLQIFGGFMHVFIGVVDVVLGDVQLLALLVHQRSDLLLNTKHILHLVLNFKQLLGLGFDELSLKQHVLVDFHHLNAVLRVVLIVGRPPGVVREGCRLTVATSICWRPLLRERCIPHGVHSR